MSNEGVSVGRDGLPPDEVVMADFSTSYWLRNAWEGARGRDPVDSLNDAILLVRLLERRVEAAQGRKSPSVLRD